MDKIRSLIKIDFNNTFGISAIKYNFKNKKNRWQTIVLAFAMLSLIPTYLMMINGLMSIYDVYVQLGQRSYFLQMGILGAQMFVFLFGILYVMSKYYFANDLEQLVPLPIKPSHILGSKFVTLMISEYLTSLPIILPFIVIYGRGGGEGIGYWIYSLFIVLTLPVIPLVISSILVMVFMKYTNIKGKKDLLRIVGGIMFLFIVLFLQFQMQKITQRALMEGEDFFFELARDSNLMVKRLGVIFPPSMWASLSLANYNNLQGLTNILITLVVSALSYTIMIGLSEKLFFAGLIGNMEVDSSKGREMGSIRLEKSARMTKPYVALAKKELTMLMKTPVYVLNSVGGVIIIPVIIIMSMITGDQSISEIRGFIEPYPHYIVLIAVGIITLLGVMNSIGSTTFSREGKNMWIQRTLPIKAKDQIIGRVLSSLAVQLIGVAALLVGVFFIVKIQVTDIIIISILGLLGSIAMTEIGMIIDILRPLLTWDNPQRAIKQNFNVLISMGVGALYIGGLFLLSKYLIDKIDFIYIYLILGVIFIVSSYILFKILETLIDKQFRDLE